jgi:hypothetical protein
MFSRIDTDTLFFHNGKTEFHYQSNEITSSSQFQKQKEKTIIRIKVDSGKWSQRKQMPRPNYHKLPKAAKKRQPKTTPHLDRGFHQVHLNRQPSDFKLKKKLL